MMMMMMMMMMVVVVVVTLFHEQNELNQKLFALFPRQVLE